MPRGLQYRIEDKVRKKSPTLVGYALLVVEFRLLCRVVDTLLEHAPEYAQQKIDALLGERDA